MRRITLANVLVIFLSSSTKVTHTWAVRPTKTCPRGGHRLSFVHSAIECLRTKGRGFEARNVNASAQTRYLREVTSVFRWKIPLQASSQSTASTKIYDVPGSGWASPQWNWGFAVGTGHECAMICRQRWATRKSRHALVEALLDPAPPTTKDTTVALDILPNDRFEPPFEEVKLILGLAWQSGRWDGSDGGVGGYGEVLATMARAQRYEPSYSPDCTQRLILDMAERYGLLKPSDSDALRMNEVITNLEKSATDLDILRRRCAGLVLLSMGFIEKGL